MRHGAAAALFLVGLAMGCAERPNVLLITLDTTRADAIGAYGDQARTPSIDRLAGEGVQFLRAIATSQCTNPSHASMLTGLYLARHNVYNNKTALSGEAVTLAEVLRQEGYRTVGAVSAYHLNARNSSLDQGFDIFLGSDARELRAGQRNDSLLQILKVIDAGEQPFFAWVHYFDPHGDYQPPGQFARMYEPGSDHEPVPTHSRMNIGRLRQQPTVDPDEMIALYKGEVSYMDAEIGRLLQLVEDIGDGDNTLVILVADHGESLTEKEIYFSHAGLYNQVQHVPFIMKLPGVIPAGTRVESLVTPADIFATTIELLGLAPSSEALDGRSLVPTFADPDAEVHPYVISEAVDGAIRSIHQGDYKYVRATPQEWSMPEESLFKPFLDPGETSNLMTSEAGVAREMRELLDAWLERSRRAALPADTGTVDERTREALKTLGYVD